MKGIYYGAQTVRIDAEPVEIDGRTLWVSARANVRTETDTAVGCFAFNIDFDGFTVECATDNDENEIHVPPGSALDYAIFKAVEGRLESRV